MVSSPRIIPRKIYNLEIWFYVCRILYEPYSLFKIRKFYLANRLKSQQSIVTVAMTILLGQLISKLMYINKFTGWELKDYLI